MNLFEKGMAIWAVAIAAGGIWLYASSDLQVKAAATIQSQPETQPPAAVQAQPAPQPVATVQLKPVPQPPVASPAESDDFLRAKQAVIRGLKDPDSARWGKIF